jgi:predicted RNA-binding protein associated with RNAse of E/G family
MDRPKLYRRRFIPNETVELKNDEIIRLDEDILLTKWKVLKPRDDFSHGVSCFHLKKGWKISRMMDDGNNCLYTYCDIMEIVRNYKENFILFNDLLVDVIVYDDGFVKVLDMAEVSDALDLGLITIEMAKSALRILDSLLDVIYSGRFEELLESFKSEALL